MNQQTLTSRSDDDLNVNKDSSRGHKIVASVNKYFKIEMKWFVLSSASKKVRVN